MVLTGRGGFGNFSPHLSAKETNNEPAPIQHYSSPQMKVHTGRGGAGNQVPISQIPTLSPSEYLTEIEVQQKKAKASPYFHVGRGGSGNFTANISSFLKGSTGNKETNSSSATNSPNAAPSKGSSEHAEPKKGILNGLRSPKIEPRS